MKLVFTFTQDPQATKFVWKKPSPNNVERGTDAHVEGSLSDQLEILSMRTGLNLDELKKQVIIENTHSRIITLHTGLRLRTHAGDHEEDFVVPKGAKVKILGLEDKTHDTSGNSGGADHYWFKIQYSGKAQKITYYTDSQGRRKKKRQNVRLDNHEAIASGEYLDGKIRIDTQQQEPPPRDDQPLESERPHPEVKTKTECIDGKLVTININTGAVISAIESDQCPKPPVNTGTNIATTEVESQILDLTIPLTSLPPDVAGDFKKFNTAHSAFVEYKDVFTWLNQHKPEEREEIVAKMEFYIATGETLPTTPKETSELFEKLSKNPKFSANQRTIFEAQWLLTTNKEENTKKAKDLLESLKSDAEVGTQVEKILGSIEAMENTLVAKTQDVTGLTLYRSYINSLALDRQGEWAIQNAFESSATSQADNAIIRDAQKYTELTNTLQGLIISGAATDLESAIVKLKSNKPALSTTLDQFHKTYLKFWQSSDVVDAGIHKPAGAVSLKDVAKFKKAQLALAKRLFHDESLYDAAAEMYGSLFAGHPKILEAKSKVSDNDVRDEIEDIDDDLPSVSEIINKFEDDGTAERIRGQLASGEELTIRDPKNNTETKFKASNPSDVTEVKNVAYKVLEMLSKVDRTYTRDQMIDRAKLHFAINEKTASDLGVDGLVAEALTDYQDIHGLEKGWDMTETTKDWIWKEIAINIPLILVSGGLAAGARWAAAKGLSWAAAAMAGADAVANVGAKANSIRGARLAAGIGAASFEGLMFNQAQNMIVEGQMDTSLNGNLMSALMFNVFRGGNFVYGKGMQKLGIQEVRTLGETLPNWAVRNTGKRTRSGFGNYLAQRTLRTGFDSGLMAITATTAHSATNGHIGHEMSGEQFAKEWMLFFLLPQLGRGAEPKKVASLAPKARKQMKERAKDFFARTPKDPVEAYKFNLKKQKEARQRDLETLEAQSRALQNDLTNKKIKKEAHDKTQKAIEAKIKATKKQINEIDTQLTHDIVNINGEPFIAGEPVIIKKDGKLRRGKITQKKGDNVTFEFTEIGANGKPQTKPEVIAAHSPTITVSRPPSLGVKPKRQNWIPAPVKRLWGSIRKTESAQGRAAEAKYHGSMRQNRVKELEARQRLSEAEKTLRQKEQQLVEAKAKKEDNADHIKELQDARDIAQEAVLKGREDIAAINQKYRELRRQYRQELLKAEPKSAPDALKDVNASIAELRAMPEPTLIKGGKAKALWRGRELRRLEGERSQLLKQMQEAANKNESVSKHENRTEAEAVLKEIQETGATGKIKEVTSGEKPIYEVHLTSLPKKNTTVNELQNLNDQIQQHSEKTPKRFRKNKHETRQRKLEAQRNELIKKLEKQGEKGDPVSQHRTLEEANTVVRQLQEAGIKDAHSKIVNKDGSTFYEVYTVGRKVQSRKAAEAGLGSAKEGKNINTDKLKDNNTHEITELVREAKDLNFQDGSGNVLFITRKGKMELIEANAILEGNILTSKIDGSRIRIEKVENADGSLSFFQITKLPKEPVTKPKTEKLEILNPDAITLENATYFTKQTKSLRVQELTNAPNNSITVTGALGKKIKLLFEKTGLGEFSFPSKPGDAGFFAGSQILANGNFYRIQKADPANGIPEVAAKVHPSGEVTFSITP